MRPKTPARIRKAKRKRRSSASGHPELIGLGLLAAGLFLASVLLLGWDGGVVGEKVESVLDGAIGGARLALPVVLVVVGALMVTRSGLVDVRPFRTGLVVFALGLLTILGAERGGFVGEALDAIFGRLLGSTGAFILGAFALTTGVILLTGASVGALLRRSAGAARTAGAKARRGPAHARVLRPSPIPQPAEPRRGPCGAARSTPSAPTPTS